MRRTHNLQRKSNALVLSESLNEDEVQTLVREALGDLFPKQCKDWHVRKQHINEIFSQERREKNIAVARGLADAEDSLQTALREQVIDHVISIFPYVHLRSCLNQSRRCILDPGRWDVVDSLPAKNVLKVRSFEVQLSRADSDTQLIRFKHPALDATSRYSHAAPHDREDY